MVRDFGQFGEAIEDLQEQILELMSHNVTVREIVNKEVIQRFGSDFDRISQDGKDEMVCVVQLLVYRRILGGIA